MYIFSSRNTIFHYCSSNNKEKKKREINYSKIKKIKEREICILEGITNKKKKNLRKKAKKKEERNYLFLEKKKIDSCA